MDPGEGDDSSAAAARAGEERDLRRRVLRGDVEAWRILWERSFDRTYAFCLRRTGEPALADDAVQESWLVAVRRIREFDPDRASFDAWILGIARRVSLAQLRRQHRQRSCDVDVAALGAEPDASNQETADLVTFTLAGLPRRYRDVLRAKYVDGHSVATIAQSFSLTDKAVESLLSRARAAFRQKYRTLTTD